MGTKILLKKILGYIEENINETITLEKLADETGFSRVYIKKAFRAAFGFPISDYIRKRKLSKSTLMLLNTDLRIADISAEYGFEFPQSYINAFKREYGITPYRWKLTPSELELTEKIDADSIIGINEGTVIPTRVILPKIMLCGVKHSLGFTESRTEAPKRALEFWENERRHIQNISERGVYYGLTKNYDQTAMRSDYYCAVSVREKNAGFENVSIASGKYIKFVYIGNHSYKRLSAETAKSMYEAIEIYFEKEKIVIDSLSLYFERVDTNLCAEDFCVMEWYIPYK